MRRFVLGWKTLGHETRYQARIVNYADDFVILCRRRAEDALAAMRDMMQRLKLTVNETKTHVCRLPAESFDFLGYTFGRMYSPRTGGAYLGARPRARRCSGSAIDSTSWWASCRRSSGRKRWSTRSIRCCAGGPTTSVTEPTPRRFTIVHRHACRRVRRWLRRKFELDGQGYRQYPDSHLERELGLLNLEQFPRRYSWAKP